MTIAMFLSIINVYRPYDDNRNIEGSITIIQQWDILEERDIDEVNI